MNQFKLVLQAEAEHVVDRCPHYYETTIDARLLHRGDEILELVKAHGLVRGGIEMTNAGWEPDWVKKEPVRHVHGTALWVQVDGECYIEAWYGTNAHPLRTVGFRVSALRRAVQHARPYGCVIDREHGPWPMFWRGGILYAVFNGHGFHDRVEDFIELHVQSMQSRWLAGESV